MGSYNVLTANVKCSNCNNYYNANIQFKYGNTWQFHYKIGDKLNWGGNEIGKPGKRKVKVYGILESERCSLCGEENKNTEFDIFIEDGIIVNVCEMKEYDYPNDEEYNVLVE